LETVGKLYKGSIMLVKVTATIECQVAASEDAHALGQELETRLVTSINGLIPNLRHAQQIQKGVVRLSMEIQGRRLTIQNSNGQERLQVQDPEENKKRK
jgi:hypothetical protein